MVSSELLALLSTISSAFSHALLCVAPSPTCSYVIIRKSGLSLSPLSTKRATHSTLHLSAFSSLSSTKANPGTQIPGHIRCAYHDHCFLSEPPCITLADASPPGSTRLTGLFSTYVYRCNDSGTSTDPITRSRWRNRPTAVSYSLARRC